jgi:chromosome segregation ATPase
MDATTTEDEITKFQEDIEKEELQQIGGKVEVDQSKTIVKGQAEEEDKTKNIVKGQAEEKDNSKTTISSDEAEAAGKITIEGANENNVNKTNEVQEIKTIDNSLELQLADLDRKFRALEAKHVKYVEQNAKMKKIIDQFKTELVKNKLANTTTTSIDPNTGETIISGANGAHAMTIEEIHELKNREKMLSKAKTDLENLLSSKEQRINQLESRIENFKSEFLKTKEFADKERLLELESENKMLQAKLDLVNKNLASVVSNKENKENDALMKREREIETLKTQMQMAQTLINKFKKEKSDLEDKFRADADELRKLKLELAKEKITDKKIEGGSHAPTHNQIQEVEKQYEEKIHTLVAERKIIEDKYKEQSLEFKKLEHKLKMTSSQLEEAGRKNKSEKGKGQPSDTVIRQLEFANKKLSETTEDLTEKKRDLIKLKQENQQLNAKLQEVEKKLLMMTDKKAA